MSQSMAIEVNADQGNQLTDFELASMILLTAFTIAANTLDQHSLSTAEFLREVSLNTKSVSVGGNTGFTKESKDLAVYFLEQTVPQIPSGQDAAKQPAAR